MSISIPQTDIRAEFAWKHALIFIGALVISLSLAMIAYVWNATQRIQASPIPSTYKWFLLQDVPGPRLIIDSGSNSHHGLDTDIISKALGITAINIADNGGYDLEQKIARLIQHTRRGDVVVLPLEWSYYTRDELTDDFVANLPGLNRDYFNGVSWRDQIDLALSLPPSAVFKFGGRKAQAPDPTALTPIQALYVAALMRPTGHSAFETARPLAAGVEGQTCDAYLFSETPLEVSSKFKRALKRLSDLQAKGVEVVFAWPVMAGDACMSEMVEVSAFAEQIEAHVSRAGFDFIGRPMQNVYPLQYRDDTPYHLTRAGADLHTERFISLLNIHGIRPEGARRDVSAFARTHLYELERKTMARTPLEPFPTDQVFRVEDKALLEYVDFAAGWWTHEPYGRWMRDHQAVFRVYIPEDLKTGAQLQMSGIMADFDIQHVNILLNGAVIGSGGLGAEQVLAINLDTAARDEEAIFHIRFTGNRLVQSPYDKGQNQDQRTLTFHLQSLSLQTHPQIPASVTQAPAAQPETPTLGNTWPLNRPVFLGDPASDALIDFGEGWWDRESGGRWMGCCEAQFSLQLPADMPATASLKISGDVFGGERAVMQAKLKGGKTIDALYSKDEPFLIPLKEFEAGQRAHIILEFPERGFESPKTLGLGEDSRVLSGFVGFIEVSVP